MSLPSQITFKNSPDYLSVEAFQPIRITTRLETFSNRRKLNQYIRDVRIGKGKHGEVYLCRDGDTNGREVAIKVVRRSNPRDKIKLLRRNYQQSGEGSTGTQRYLLNSTENSIRKEIAVMKKCRHPNLACLLEVIDDPQEEKIYLVLEYLPGGPVEWSNLEHEPLLTVTQTRRIIRDLILGVQFLHSKGILHRDIKPSNIIYAADRRSVKLIDFGVSHYTPPASFRVKAEPFDPQLDALFPPTDLLKRIGTPSFLAPEVVWFSDSTADLSTSGSTSYDTFSPSSDSHTAVTSTVPIPKVRPPITEAIDIWSLAVTFYCFLFGQTPFHVSSSGNDNVHHSEFMLYNLICTQDWHAKVYMGAERIPTGGRHPKDPTSDGYIVIRLLDGMLQKDPKHRLSLSEVKRNPFILCDVYNPREWIRSTTPPAPETITSCWVKCAARKFLGLLSPQR